MSKQLVKIKSPFVNKLARKLYKVQKENCELRKMLEHYMETSYKYNLWLEEVLSQ